MTRSSQETVQQTRSKHILVVKLHPVVFGNNSGLHPRFRRQVGVFELRQQPLQPSHLLLAQQGVSWRLQRRLATSLDEIKEHLQLQL